METTLRLLLLLVPSVVPPLPSTVPTTNPSTTPGTTLPVAEVSDIIVLTNIDKNGKKSLVLIYWLKLATN